MEQPPPSTVINDPVLEHSYPARPRILRPPNAFMLFAQERRRSVAAQHPQEKNKQISTRLGQLWRELIAADREEYHRKAAETAREHRNKYPDYVYNPRKARQRKAEIREARMSKMTTTTSKNLSSDDATQQHQTQPESSSRPPKRQRSQQRNPGSRRARGRQLLASGARPMSAQEKNPVKAEEQEATKESYQAEPNNTDSCRDPPVSEKPAMIQGNSSVLGKLQDMAAAQKELMGSNSFATENACPAMSSEETSMAMLKRTVPADRGQSLITSTRILEQGGKAPIDDAEHRNARTEEQMEGGLVGDRIAIPHYSVLQTANHLTASQLPMVPQSNMGRTPQFWGTVPKYGSGERETVQMNFLQGAFLEGYHQTVVGLPVQEGQQRPNETSARPSLQQGRDLNAPFNYRQGVQPLDIPPVRSYPSRKAAASHQELPQLCLQPDHFGAASCSAAIQLPTLTELQGVSLGHGGYSCLGSTSVPPAPGFFPWHPTACLYPTLQAFFNDPLVPIDVEWAVPPGASNYGVD